MTTRLRIHARRDSFLGDAISVYVAIKGPDTLSVGLPVVFQQQSALDASLTLAPTMMLAPDAAQELMDELWQCGFRPTEGTGSAGSLAATQRHLEDMRALVFKTKAPGK